ncbi:MAG: hypothetical protein JO261_16200 [Alphaproteobacteria bacterium]|nr:hypothetical protein [Alphaproteobacteria bacterium]MBV9695234.1 hypothetical protein [Alphaproteobacteria bacterium]
MLLSLSRKFIFVANLKSASSAIEAVLGPKAEIRFSQTQFGKHDGLSVISQKYSWVKRYVPYEEFCVLSVVRDPVDYLLSLYNSHHKPDFDGKPHSTKGLSFDDFLETWCGRSWQARPQHLRFVDSHGRFKLSHLLRFENLEAEFAAICKTLRVGRLELPHRNPSPAVLTRQDLSASQIATVRERYAEDYAWIDRRPQSP